MKKIYFKKIILSLALIVIASTTVFAQMNYFTLPPRKWNVSNFTATNTLIPNAPNSSHIVSNGAYDESGNLLFYIVDKGVYNSSSTQIGTLLEYYATGDPTNNDCGYKYSGIGTEISIVPIPNTCKQYYVIFSMSTCYTSIAQLLYMKVDCSSGSPVLSSPTESFGFPKHYINSFGLSFGGIAVSKLLPGNTSRYLFAVGANGSSMQRYVINANGIGAFSGVAPVTVANYQTHPSLFSSGGPVNELDLSPNGQYIAWGGINYNDKVNILTLNSSFNVTAGVRYNFMKVKGVEFDAANARLFVSSDPGISYINLSTGVVSYIAGSSAYNNTAIELSSYRKLYFVSNSGTIGQINAFGSSVAITAGPAGAVLSNKNCLLSNDNAFRLNDQVDGENYNYYGVGYAIADGTDYCNRTSVTASVVAYNGTVQWQQKSVCSYNDDLTPTYFTDIQGATSYSYTITPATTLIRGTSLRARITCNGSTTYTNAVDIKNLDCGQYTLPCPTPWRFRTIQPENESTKDNEEFSVNTYPNPSDGIVKLDATHEIVAVEVYNALGAMVLKITNIDAKQVTIDISAQPKGLYFMKIANASGNILHKNIAIQ